MDIVCNVCGKGFTASRSDARFCSPKCRTANHRKAHEIDTPPRKRVPVTEVFWRATYDLERKAERVQRLAHDDRVPRHKRKLAERNLPELLIAREAIDEAIRVLDPRYGKPLIEQVSEQIANYATHCTATEL